MSAHVPSGTDVAGGPPPEDAEHRSGDHRHGRLRAFVEAALVVVALLAVGFLGGRWWHSWWAPAPTGVVGIPATGDDQTPRWFPVPGEAGERAFFAATAEYVVVAVILGLLVGLLAALLARRSAFVTLIALVVGSALAAFVMYRYGTSLGPVDPATRVPDLDPGDPLLGNLTISGWTPYLAWPVGALLGFALAGFVMVAVGRVRDKGDDPTWLKSIPQSTPQGTSGDDVGGIGIDAAHRGEARTAERSRDTPGVEDPER